MQRFNVRWLALLAITVVAIYLCWLIVEPFLDVIIWSVVLAVILYPLHLRFRRRGMGPTLASLSTCCALVIIALVPLTLIVVSAVGQIDEGTAMVKNGIDEAKHIFASQSRFSQLLHKIAPPDMQNPDAVADQLKQKIGAVAKESFAIVSGVAGTIAQTVIKIAFTLFTIFYLLRDAEKIGQTTMNLLPLEEEQSRRVWRRCRDVIKASVQGVMVIAAAQALLGGLAFWALGIPSALLWGFLMFFAALIPAVGTTLVWGPAAIFLLIGSHWIKAIVLIAFCGGVIGLIDNFLRPRLVGQKAGLHDLTIFFSVLGGLEAFGLPGLFIGPVVIALTLAVIEAFRQMSPTATFKPTASKEIIFDVNASAMHSSTQLAAGTVPASADLVSPTPTTVEHVPPIPGSGTPSIIVPSSGS